jgi:hypothetical protein
MIRALVPRLNHVLRDWFSLGCRGLWPFTPDPAPPGLHLLGTPTAGMPILMSLLKKGWFKIRNPIYGGF